MPDTADSCTKTTMALGGRGVVVRPTTVPQTGRVPNDLFIYFLLFLLHHFIIRWMHCTTGCLIEVVVDGAGANTQYTRFVFLLEYRREILTKDVTICMKVRPYHQLQSCYYTTHWRHCYRPHKPPITMWNSISIQWSWVGSWKEKKIDREPQWITCS